MQFPLLFPVFMLILDSPLDMARTSRENEIHFCSGIKALQVDVKKNMTFTTLVRSQHAGSQTTALTTLFTRPFYPCVQIYEERRSGVEDLSILSLVMGLGKR